MAHFSILGYSTTGHAGERTAARGVLEIAAFTPSYELPYLGTGIATRSVARGVLELPSTWNTDELGKTRLFELDVAGLRFVFPRVVPAHFPPRESQRGRVAVRRGFPAAFTATPLSVQAVRVGRSVPPHPDWLRGRARLRKGISENIAPPPFLPPQLFVAQPPRFPLPTLRGRVRLSPGKPAAIQPTAISLLAPRIARPARFPVALRRGRHRWLTPHKARLFAELALLAEFAVSVEAELALRADLDVFTADQYRVVLRNSVTSEELVLGTGTSITGVAIPDGDYVLRVEVDGRYWQGARFRAEYAVSISGGELVAALPPIVSLRAGVAGASINVTWKIEPLSGLTAPTEFAVWADDTSPVDTSGAPAVIATYAGVGGYFVQLAAAPTSLFVAVAARLGAQVGPISEVAVTGEAAADPTSPTGVSGRIPDGEWA